LLGQAGESVGVFEFLRFDARSCELGLDESEPNTRFLLVIRTKFHLGCYCRSYGLNQIQRFVGHLSQEEQNMAATMKLGVHKQMKTDSLYKKKYFCWSECDTHNLK
jgi:hypothetical protein